MTIEILAPAGGQEQMIAAVRSGADAIYLGTRTFNARRNAENFDGQSVSEAVQYCHGRGVRVYVAVNTLVKEGELSSLYKEIEMLAECGVDGAIVQDLGAAEMFKRYCPSMPLHASTQMTIHNREGVLAAEELGFSRVILARELTLEEIREIAAIAKIELETFVHGALCMSVSGQCYLSSILGGRSGNRGLCAQPCRLDFKSGERDYALSLKDMSHINHIGALMEAGVSSLKIEGRMKRPEYVAAAVSACRQAVSGKTVDLARLRAVFSRSGFTEGYITGKRNLDMFGYRTKEDIESAKTVRGEIASGYRNELSRVPVDMRLMIKENEKAFLEVTDGDHSVMVSGDRPEPAKTRCVDYPFVLKSLAKTGGTPFTLRTLTTDLDQSQMFSSAKLNAMRKEALDKLLEARSRIISRQVLGPFVQPPVYKQVRIPKYRVRIQNQHQLFAGIEQADKIYLPFREIDQNMIDEFGEKVIAELPRLVFPLQEKALANRLEKLRNLGVKNVCAGNLGTIRLARQIGFTVHGSFDSNIINSLALIKYESLGLNDTLLSCEINLGEAANLGGNMERGIVGYGHLPLMIFRNCPAQEKNGCGKCQGIKEISDRTGARFKILCSNREYSNLLNHLPLYVADKKVPGVDFVTLYFTLENSQECKKIWENYRTGAPSNSKFTRGLYYRKLI